MPGLKFLTLNAILFSSSPAFNSSMGLWIHFPTGKRMSQSRTLSHSPTILSRALRVQDEGSRCWSLKAGSPFLQPQKSLWTKELSVWEAKGPTTIQALPDPEGKSSPSAMTLVAPKPCHPAGSLTNVPGIGDPEMPSGPAEERNSIMILRTSG